MDIHNLPVRKIKRLASIQPRDSINDERVADFAELLSESPEFQFPPLLVFHTPTGEYVLAGGFHRIQAYTMAERTLVPCEVREGDAEDAAWAALFDNGKHGTPLSRFERKVVIQKALGHTKRGDLTQEDIAKLFGVSVSTIKREVSDQRKAGKIPHSSRSEGSNEPLNTPMLDKGQKKPKFSPEVLEAIAKISACNENAAAAILNGSIKKPEDELIAYSEMDCDQQVRLAPYFLTHDLNLASAINASQKRPTNWDRPMKEFVQYAQMHGTDQTFYFCDDSVEVFVGLLAQTPALPPAPKKSPKQEVAAKLGVTVPEEEEELI